MLVNCRPVRRVGKQLHPWPWHAGQKKYGKLRTWILPSFKSPSIVWRSSKTYCLCSKIVQIRLLEIQGTSAVRQSSHAGIASNHTSYCHRISKWAGSQSWYLIPRWGKWARASLKSRGGSVAAAGEGARLLWQWAAARQQLCCSAPVKAEGSTYWNIQVNSGSPTSAHISCVTSA